jgi:hypothetical protein
MAAQVRLIAEADLSRRQAGRHSAEQEPSR